MRKRYSTLRRGLALTTLLTGSVLAGRAQNVGIGTTTPNISAALDIVSSGKGVLLPRVADATAITSPATGLIVFQTGGTAGYYYNAGTAAAPSWQQLATATSLSSNFIQNGTAQQAASFNVSGSGTIGGAVSIGGPSVAASVQAYGNSAVSTQGAYLQWNRSNGEGETWVINQKGLSNSNYGIRFGSSTTANVVTEHMRIQGETGQVGIGTLLPTARLHVRGTGNAYPATTGITQSAGLIGRLQTGNNLILDLGGNSTNGAWLQSTDITNLALNYPLLLNPNGGSVGIGLGTSSPRAPLEVGGIALVGGGALPNTSNTTGIGWNAVNSGFGETELYNYRGLGQGGFRFFSIANTGTPSTSNQIAYINAAGNYSSLSDRRVKTNIVGLQHGLRTVLALRPVSYDFHTSRRFDHGVVTFLPDDQPVKALGFVAQELYQVLPEAVEKPQDERTGLYTVSYTSLVPVLTQAIQEQQAQIEALKSQNAALAAKAAILENRAAQAETDHASLLTLQAQMARLLGETAPADAQARK